MMETRVLILNSSFKELLKILENTQKSLNLSFPWKSVRRDSQGRFSGNMGISGGISKKNYPSSFLDAGRKTFNQGSSQQRRRPPMAHSRRGNTKASQSSQHESVASASSMMQCAPCPRCGRAHTGECWTCFNCGEKGHIAKYCYKRRKEDQTFSSSVPGRVFALTSE
ncbi:hypothetical protein K1719_022725 [Acacia pycnantha]|nr:hypothetical protein K1719_022725 [Acacia pycnantha]